MKFLLQSEVRCPEAGHLTGASVCSCVNKVSSGGEKEPWMGSWRAAGPDVSVICEVGWWALVARHPPLTWRLLGELPGCQSLTSQSPGEPVMYPADSAWLSKWPPLAGPPFRARSLTGVCQCPHPHLYRVRLLHFAPALPPASEALPPCCHGAWTRGDFLKPAVPS